MSDEPKTRVDWIELIDLFDKEVLQAVEVEREQLAAVLLTAEHKAIEAGNYRAADALRDCIDAIRKPEPEPPPEPMTIEKVIERLKDCQGVITNWKAVEIDLLALVQAQARRDAELASGSQLVGCDCISRTILKSAGLE